MRDRMNPFNFQQIFDLAKDHHRAGRLSEAEQLYRQILARRPQHAESLHLLGIIAGQVGRGEISIELIGRAIQIMPANGVFHTSLGNALKTAGRLDEAIAAYRTANRLAPEIADAYHNLGDILQTQGKQVEAIAEFRRAVAIKPNWADAHNNLGMAFEINGQMEKGIAEFRRAIAINPNLAEAHFNLAMALLLIGELPQAWEELEWRWKCKDFPSRQRNFPQPQWNGQPLEGRALLLHAEQGIGDTLQFARYIPLVARLGGKIILECEGQLQRLLQPIAGESDFAIQGRPLPAFDLHCPLLSLAKVFKTDLHSIPADVPYLKADPRDVAQWAARLGPSDSRLRIALNWAGNPGFLGDSRRSMNIRQLASLAALEGVIFYSIQKGPAEEQADQPPPGLRLINLGPDLADFADTAAVMSLMDGVLTTDTSVPHLAGALARPVWLMLQFAPDWRWMIERQDTPWYPTMRLFRQRATGDWDGVIARVVEELSHWIKSNRRLP